MSRKVVQSVAESTSGDSGVLVGRCDHMLDPKRRLTIPSGWRKTMGNPDFVYVMPDRKEKCLNLMPKAEMDVLLGQIREKALFDPALNRVYQVIGSMSEQLDLDVQGRIRISDKLLQFANLTTTVAMLGSFRMIKLWNPEALPPVDKVDAAALDEALAAAGL